MKAALTHAARSMFCIGLCLLLFAGIGFRTKATGADFTVGAHLATAHFHNSALESFTPGLYGRVDSGDWEGFTAGVFRNSYERTSAYIGWTWETPGRTFALTTGAVTGYPAASVMPLIVPSVRLPITDGWDARLAYIPKPKQGGTSDAVHLAVERSF